MNKVTSDKRSRLVKAAAELSYARGLSQIALADVAQRSRVPLGNIYYYFKTKAALGDAIIARRSEEFRELKQIWDKAPTPKMRLKAFIQMTVENREALTRYGCPVGSLCAELGKEDGVLAKRVADPFRELLAWIEMQFAAIDRDKDPEALAMHLLAALQGISLLANCLRNAKVIVREATHLHAWIDAL